jgi:hypothetical protein
LGTRTTHGRSLATIQDAKLDSTAVGDAPHETVERIDFANQVAFAEPSNRRIAGHGTDRLEAMRDEGRPRAQASRSRCGLAAGVSPADNDDVKSLHGFAPVSPV